MRLPNVLKKFLVGEIQYTLISLHDVKITTSYQIHQKYYQPDDVVTMLSEYIVIIVAKAVVETVRESGELPSESSDNSLKSAADSSGELNSMITI